MAQNTPVLLYNCWFCNHHDSVICEACTGCGGLTIATQNKSKSVDLFSLTATPDGSFRLKNLLPSHCSAEHRITAMWITGDGYRAVFVYKASNGQKRLSIKQGNQIPQTHQYDLFKARNSPGIWQPLFNAIDNIPTQ